MMGSHGYDVGALHQFAKPAADAVALGGGADLARHREADSGRAGVVATSRLQDESRASHARPTGSGNEIPALFQPVHEFNRRMEWGRSGAQTLAAAGAACGENLAAAGGRQTGAKAVTALAHQFAGLIGPLHGRSPLPGIPPWAGCLVICAGQETAEPVNGASPPIGPEGLGWAQNEPARSNRAIADSWRGLYGSGLFSSIFGI